MPILLSCTLIEKRLIGPETYWFTLGCGDMVERTLRAPGQFVHIACGDKLLRRPISVCAWASGRPEDTLSLVFEVRGEGTRWLSLRQPGEKLDVLGLLGNGFSITPGGRYLLAGGGIGAPPLHGCAQYIRSLQGRAVAVTGFRSADRVILTQELGDHCEGVYVYTDDGSFGTKGYVQDGISAILDKDRDFTAILACGPMPMLRGVARTAAQYGVPCQVSLEERMACGVGACLGCAVRLGDGSMKHVCKDGPVFDAGEVDWNG